MFFGDNPLKINERVDAFGMTTYTLVPDINAIRQSGNRYVYCMNNPVMYVDENGNFVITTAVLVGIGVSTLLGGLVGGYVNHSKGNGINQRHSSDYAPQN